MNQTKITKKSKVLHHLLKNKSITSIEAIKYYSATRLSAIIYNLKKDGYKFKSERIPFEDKFGNKAYFNKYHLIGKEEK